MTESTRSTGVQTEAQELARLTSVYRERRKEAPLKRYSWTRPTAQFAFLGAFRACIRHLSAASRFPLDGQRIADIGCGTGNWLLEFLQWGAYPEKLAGIDLNPDCVEAARRRLPTADLHTGTANRLPWPDSSFDIVSQFTLFTSILNGEMRQSIAREMLRILKPGGIILWYDFWANNPRNKDVRGVRAREIRELFPDCKVSLDRVELAPPIARTVVPVSWALAWCLERIWLLRTHYIATIQKPAASE